MKVLLRQAGQSRKQIMARLQKWSAHPIVRPVVACLRTFAAGFVLAGVSVDGIRMPLAVALTAALGLGLPSFFAYLGGCLGAGVFWGWGAVLEPMAAGLLVVACACIFGEASRGRWFGPVSAAVYTALVGFLFLLEQGFAPAALWQWTLRWTAAFAFSHCFRQVKQDRAARLILLCCLCGGLCAVKLPGDLPLGTVAASALTLCAMGTELSFPAAVCLGLSLDLVWQPGCAAAVFLLGNLAAGKQKRRVVQMAVWFVSVFLGVLFTDSSHLFLAGSLLGVLCAWPLSGMRIFGGEIAAQTENTRQHLLAELLQQMSQCLMQPCRSRPEPETAAVFDRAAERVCRLCARREDCWDTRGQETYLALEQAAVPMMTRGKALREDFPMAFSAQCRHMEGLLQAMNREMDDLSCRRQYRSRLRESRTVLAQQYAALSHALVQELREDAPCRYAPEIGFRSLGRRDSTVSGDRGAGFRRGKWYFVLLCDGMGTGQWAKAEAETAIEILRSLLQAGTSAEEALQVLNGIYILRDDGGFATVDLLQADLQTGAAVLYKWGAAPSYYKQKDTVKQLRSSQLPPGVEAAPMSGGRGIPLDLGQGEVLLLVSDGVDADAAERYIRQHSGRSVKELASGVIAAGGAENRDDTTAVAVCLHRE